MADSLKIKITATASEYSQLWRKVQQGGRHNYQKFTVSWQKKQFLMKTSSWFTNPCNKLNYRLCEGSVAVWLLLTRRHLKRLSYKICKLGKQAVKFRITRLMIAWQELVLERRGPPKYKINSPSYCSWFKYFGPNLRKQYFDLYSPVIICPYWFSW